MNKLGKSRASPTNQRRCKITRASRTDSDLTPSSPLSDSFPSTCSRAIERPDYNDVSSSGPLDLYSRPHLPPGRRFTLDVCRRCPLVHCFDNPLLRHRSRWSCPEEDIWRIEGPGPYLYEFVWSPWYRSQVGDEVWRLAQDEGDDSQGS